MEGKNSLRAAIYVRVSDDQQRSNYSPPTQLRDCLRYAAEHEYSVVGDRFADPATAQDAARDMPGAVPAYVDDHTSLVISRPALDAALAYASTSGFDVLIVHSLDRLARDPYIRQTLERELGRRGAKVHYVLGDYDDTPEGEVRKDLDATFAKWENTKRVERSLRGKVGKAQRGLFVGGRPPYGYGIDRDAPGGLRVVEEQARIVRRIFAMCADPDVSLWHIARQLSAEGIPTPKGGTQWARETVREILRDSTYVGRAYYNRRTRLNGKLAYRQPSEWIEIEVTPLVGEEVFAAAQRRLDFNRDAVRRKPTHCYLLRGMIVCGVCGRRYAGQIKRAGTSRRANDAPFYSHHKLHSGCRYHAISARKLEPAVWELVSIMIQRPHEVVRSYEAQIEGQQEAQALQRAQLETLMQAASKLRKKIDGLVELYIDAEPRVRMAKAEYAARRGRLEQELKAVEQRIEEQEAALARTPSLAGLAELERRMDAIRDYLSGDTDVPHDEKRVILEMMNVQIVVDENKRLLLKGWMAAPVPLDGVLDGTC